MLPKHDGIFFCNFLVETHNISPISDEYLIQFKIEYNGNFIGKDVRDCNTLKRKLSNPSFYVIEKEN